MDTVFIDTNIVIDLLAKREAFYKDAQKLFTLGDIGKVRICVSALSFANAHYSIARHHKTVVVRKYLSTFKVLVNVLPLNEKTIELSLASDFDDFEDGLQYFTALENNCDAIITRNKRDFRSSVIPVMTATEFLKIKYA